MRPFLSSSKKSQKEERKKRLPKNGRRRTENATAQLAANTNRRTDTKRVGNASQTQPKRSSKQPYAERTTTSRPRNMFHQLMLLKYKMVRRTNRSSSVSMASNHLNDDNDDSAAEKALPHSKEKENTRHVKASVFSSKYQINDDDDDDQSTHRSLRELASRSLRNCSDFFSRSGQRSQESWSNSDDYMISRN